MAPRCPRWHQDGPKMAQESTQTAPDGPNMSPRWPQDGSKIGQDGPKMAQEGPRWPQDGPKMSQDGPKMRPRWPQDRPRWPQDRSKHFALFFFGAKEEQTFCFCFSEDKIRLPQSTFACTVFDLSKDIFLSSFDLSSINVNHELPNPEFKGNHWIR